MRCRGPGAQRARGGSLAALLGRLSTARLVLRALREAPRSREEEAAAAGELERGGGQEEARRDMSRRGQVAAHAGGGGAISVVARAWQRSPPRAKAAVGLWLVGVLACYGARGYEPSAAAKEAYAEQMARLDAPAFVDEYMAVTNNYEDARIDLDAVKVRTRIASRPLCPFARPIAAADPATLSLSPSRASRCGHRFGSGAFARRTARSCRPRSASMTRRCVTCAACANGRRPSCRQPSASWASSAQTASPRAEMPSGYGAAHSQRRCAAPAVAEWARPARANRSSADGGVPARGCVRPRSRPLRTVPQQSFEKGKVFAQRQTFWDAVNTVLYSRQEESWVGFAIKWMFTIAINFTLGMLGAAIYFAFALWGVVTSYDPNVVTGTSASASSRAHAHARAFAPARSARVPTRAHSRRRPAARAATVLVRVLTPPPRPPAPRRHALLRGRTLLGAVDDPLRVGRPLRHRDRRRVRCATHGDQAAIAGVSAAPRTPARSAARWTTAALPMRARARSNAPSETKRSGAWLRGREPRALRSWRGRRAGQGVQGGGLSRIGGVFETPVL